MNQTYSNTVSPFTDRSYEKYAAFKSVQPAPKVPVWTQPTHDVIESPNGAFTTPNLLRKSAFGGDITGKVYLRAVHGSETPYAVQFHFERNPTDKHKGEWLSIYSRVGVHLLDWEQIGDSLQAELKAAAWVTVHDGHDFSARVLVRITVDESCPGSGKEIEVFVSADNRHRSNINALRVALPAAGERGSVRMAQRVAMTA